MPKISYPDRLRKLKLPTLTYRRARGDMMETYKLLSGKAIAMRTAVPIDLYCYADIDYTVTAVCCNVLYKPHLIAYDGY